MKKYSVKWFIKFFEKIPNEKWATGNYFNGDKQYCALGHCYNFDKIHCHDIFQTANALRNILEFKTVLINDGHELDGYKNPHSFPQKTPRGRILAALRRIDKGLPLIPKTKG